MSRAPAVTGTVRVTIAVPTFRRPGHLRCLLPLLLDQARQVTDASRGGYAVDVLVVDNDPDRSAESVVAAHAGPGLRYAWEPTPGIAAVRNRALDESADAAALAFIDDDERPAAGWLAELLRTWSATGAAGVVGRVRVEYVAGELDPWIAAGGFFARRSLPTGSSVAVAATSNLLLDLRQVRALGVRFDPALGSGGGEDSLFTRSLTGRGGCLVWCEEALVLDQLPVERANRKWVLARAWSHGNAAVLTDLRLAGSARTRAAERARGTARGVVRVAGGAARWAAGAVLRSDRHQARGLRALCRGAGMIGAACGVVFEEYARDGRRWRLSWAGAR